jgi:hypothetical protein
MRVVNSTKLREAGGRQEIRCRIISVGLDRPSEPRGRLLITAEKELPAACESLPGMGIGIARTEARCLADVSLRLFGATDENLTESDRGMGGGEISIQRQRMFTFRRCPAQHAWYRCRHLLASYGQAHGPGTQDKALVRFASAAAKAAMGLATKGLAPATTSASADPTSASHSPTRKRRYSCPTT